MKIKLSVPISVYEVAQATEAEYTGPEKQFSYIATSSLEADEQTLFFALDGRLTSGEEFVPQLSRRGIYCVTKRRGEHMLTHSSPRKALLSLAAFYKNHHLHVKKTVAITGSVGKTTTKEFLRAILAQKWNTHANEGNLNSDIGMPLTILSTPPETEMLILELGMNHAGEIAPLAMCAQADLGIITNVGHAHIGNLGTLEAIAREKMDICAHNENMPVLLPDGQALLRALRNKIIVGKDICFRVEAIVQNKVAYSMRHAGITQRIELPLLSEEILQCLFLAVGAAATLGMNAEQIQRGIDTGTSYSRRKKSYIGDALIIDDTYNASPESMHAALNYLMSQRGRHRHAILGDMLELGEHTVPLHVRLGKELAACSPDFIYLTGEHMEHTLRSLGESGFPENRIFYAPEPADYGRVAYALSKNLEPTDVCLFKASHSIKLWRAIESLWEVYRC